MAAAVLPPGSSVRYALVDYGENGTICQRDIPDESRRSYTDSSEDEADDLRGDEHALVDYGETRGLYHGADTGHSRDSSLQRVLRMRPTMSNLSTLHIPTTAVMTITRKSLCQRLKMLQCCTRAVPRC